VLLGPLNAPRPRAVRGALSKLMTPPTFERGLLFERQLELGNAVVHPHAAAPGRTFVPGASR
jgi:hypothetical protein